LAEYKKENFECLDDLSELFLLRQDLYAKKLIGANEAGLGFGNVSMKYHKGFIITGSLTGNYSKLGIDGYSYVTECSIEKNWLSCIGGTIASSESLAHAAIYKECRSKFVAHIHSSKLWKKHFDKLPTTNPSAEYGTVEMGLEVANIVKNRKAKVIIMGGHEDGIILHGDFADDIIEAIESL
jgi:hypothetical protein